YIHYIIRKLKQIQAILKYYLHIIKILTNLKVDIFLYLNDNYNVIVSSFKNYLKTFSLEVCYEKYVF
ncbi:hypothetical protein DMN34_07415, partial [Clostridium perfringens]